MKALVYGGPGVKSWTGSSVTSGWRPTPKITELLSALGEGHLKGVKAAASTPVSGCSFTATRPRG